MANVKNGRKKKIAKIVITIVILIVASVLGINVFPEYSNDITNPSHSGNISDTQSTQKPSSNSSTENPEGTLTLTMIDVGQADSFFFQQGDDTALVDCGTRSSGEDVVEYLKAQGITQIDYVFGTHPHDDHMGGMYDVITNFEIGKIIIPEIDPKHGTTNWYLKLVDEIATGDYEVEFVELGTVYTLGDAEMKVIGPISDPGDNKNNYSTVLKVSFGEMDVIMTGDAETQVEKDILESGENIQAEILKLGHHGSDTSNSSEFLDEVNPIYALISCGVGNKYEHPIKEIMQRLKERDIDVYRTDENGTVIVTITPTELSFSCAPGDYLSGPELEERKGAK